MFLLNGCYQFTGMPDENSQSQQQSTNSQNSDSEYEARKKRSTQNQNQTDDMRTICSRYAVQDKSIECKVIKNLIFFNKEFYKLNH